MAEPLTQLNQLMQFLKASDKNQEIRNKYPAGEELQQLQALNLLKQRLVELQSYKDKYPKETNTGPWAGDYWKVGPQFDQNGKAKSPGLIQKIVQMAKSDDQNSKRAVFEGMLNNTNKIAFDIGGKTLPGQEKQTALGAIPTMLVDDPEFKALNEYNINKAIPMEVERKIKTLLDAGYPKETIIKMFQGQ